MSPATAASREFDVTLPDGRVLHAYEAGDPSGVLVVYHHGTPTSGALRQEWATDAEQKGIRLVGYDRAGYGASSPSPGRTVADIAGDVASLADALEAERFCTWGDSGGGPHSLACAARLGDRVIAAATIASAAPYDGRGLDFLAGMGQDNLDEFGAAVEGAEALRPYLDAQREAFLASTADGLREVFESLLPDVDRDALTGDLAEYLHAAVLDALQHGVEGWLEDDLAFVSPWGFDVASIVVPLLLVQGAQDLMVPLAHGQWLAEHSTAEAWLLPGDGHLSVVTKVPDVHEWLLSHV
jgi:pimeloyl-ACP methyl ester carboxylesterase